MKFRSIAIILILLAVTIPGHVARGGKGSAPLLKNLRPGHPRLIALDSDVDRVKQLISTDQQAAALYQKIKAEADEIMEQPLMDYTAVDYRENIIALKVYLGLIRQTLHREYTLLTVYRIEGDKKYMERAKKELMKGAELKHWNPYHFLDTAEMTHAFAIGYDWMYHDLTEEERQIIRTAIIKKGLKPAMRSYKLGWFSGYGFWTVANHNWNQVCNGGITMGALAIADEEPELAEKILENSIESIEIPMAQFAPDGAWAEGPGYWSYATEYNVYYLAALDTALGTDFGLSYMPGFEDTGAFRIHYVGPLGLNFNYADARPQVGADDQLFWLAKKFDEPLYAKEARKWLDGSGPHGLWWFDPRGDDAAPPPRDALYKSAQVAFFRSEWNDPNAVFVAFKGGDNKANHSHLDLGSFVIDAEGVRWAMDLGKDSYKLPLYFDTVTGKRWQYYRLRTEGHNTLLIDDKNQDTKAKAPIIAYESTPKKVYATADLTEAYPAAKKITRTISLIDREKVTVKDEIETKKPVKVVWGFHTEASISIDGKKAVLTRGDKHLSVRILEPDEAFFKVLSDERPPPEATNEGISNLTVNLPEKVEQTTILVEMTPARMGM